MNMNTTTITVAVAVALASTGATAAQHAAPMHGAMPGEVVHAAPRYTDTMKALLDAAQRLREAVQVMAMQPPSDDRGHAIRAARRALMQAQRAMVDLPPEMRTTGDRIVGPGETAGAAGEPRRPRGTPSEELREASSRLLDAVTLMSAYPRGEQRGEAIADAQRALEDAHQAMMAFSSGNAQASHDMRMSRLIGMPIDDRGGRHVGEVEDLIVDTSDGRVRYAVVDVGGFLGIAEHRTAVPLDRVRATLDQGHVVIDMTAEELRRFPSYPPDDAPDWNDGGFRARVEGTVPAPAGVPTGGHRFRSAEKLLHADLRDGLGRDVGDLADIVLDLDSGEVRYGVARFDPLWAPHERLVVLRPSQVSISADDDDLTVHATQAELRRAPTFEPGRMLASNG